MVMPSAENEKGKEDISILITELKNDFAGKEDVVYTVSGDKLREVIYDDNLVGGQRTKEVKKSDELIDELNYTSLNEKSYNTLMEAYKLVESENLVHNSGPYSGIAESNTFSVKKLLELLEK